VGEPLYIYVELRHSGPGSIRPIIILGPSKELIIDRLVTEDPDAFPT